MRAQRETMLKPKRFLRIHCRTIVNASWIEEITTLSGGTSAVVGRRCRSTQLACPARTTLDNAPGAARRSRYCRRTTGDPPSACARP
jgi:hypothetical protein